MWPSSFFPDSYFTKHYWPKVGGVSGGKGKGYGGKRRYSLRYYADADAARRSVLNQKRENATALRAYLAKKAEEIEWHRKHREKRRQVAMMAAFLSEI